MKKVITYGTFDLLHYGHINLLKRAKGLGDYLIVGVTADDYDKTRGKINVQQSLIERIEGVKETGIADEIIVEEYEGQKIDDIRRYGIDIFTVGSDWVGYFDYLKEFCDVIYLDRTKGVSSTQLRSERREISIGLVGESSIVNKFARESKFVNGISIDGVCTQNKNILSEELRNVTYITNDYKKLLKKVDAIYLASHPRKHYRQIKEAIQMGKHVLCESPIALNQEQCEELFKLAEEKSCVLLEGIKTAYSTAYSRMLLLIKSGKIGNIVSVDATCTSLTNVDISDSEEMDTTWNSICAWGPTALLPIFQLLGTNYTFKQMISHLAEQEKRYDSFTKINFVYPHAVASIKVGKGVKSEGNLVVTGTKGYIYIPAPWWKTDYFEIRYENPADNKRYFYQLDGEGIRYEIVAFVKNIQLGKNMSYIEKNISLVIAHIMEEFENKNILLI